jgi:hypothetical protein
VSPITQPQAPAGAELVALGMSAAILVIVADQHPGAWPGARAQEVGRRQAADPSTHHHQVKGLPGLLRRGIPRLAIAPLMSDLLGAIVRAP